MLILTAPITLNDVFEKYAKFLSANQQKLVLSTIFLPHLRQESRIGAVQEKRRTEFGFRSSTSAARRKHKWEEGINECQKNRAAHLKTAAELKTH